jgi:uncharacterized protein (TIGR02266 family)
METHAPQVSNAALLAASVPPTDPQSCERLAAELAAEASRQDAAEQAVEARAAKLEREARKLAQEEADLQRRKRELQALAQAVGQERGEILDRRQRIEAARTALGAQLARLERSQAEREVAALREAVERQQQAAEAQRLARQQARAAAENRVDPRLHVAADVSLQTDSNFYCGLTENLSEGGLFLATWDHLPVGTELDVDLRLEGRRIQARGVVRWAREHSRFTEDVAPGVGVQFLELAPEDRGAIAAFIRRRDPLLYET